MAEYPNDSGGNVLRVAKTGASSNQTATDGENISQTQFIHIAASVGTGPSAVAFLAKLRARMAR